MPPLPRRPRSHSASSSASRPRSDSSRRSRRSISSRRSPTSPTAFGLLLTLNLGYWYSWAALTPAILWLTRRFPFDRATWKTGDSRSHRRRRRRHLAARRARRGVAHGHLLGGRRVARHVAPRSAGDAVPELRLGDDDLLDHRRRRHGDEVHARGARARTERGAARDAAGRSPPPYPAAADAAAFPVQHAQYHLGADAPRRRRRRRDDRAVERPAAHVAAASRACRKCR